MILPLSSISYNPLMKEKTQMKNGKLARGNSTILRARLISRSENIMSSSSESGI